jgi:hypothetical protein
MSLGSTLTLVVLGFALTSIASLATPAEADPALDALVAAYPGHLAGVEGNDLVWKDGSRMPVSDGRTGKTFEQLLDEPDIDDQFAYPYPLGTTLKTPALNEDPGRIRYEPLFAKMYGDCRNGEVAGRLVAVPWLPERGGGSVRVTPVNGVAETLKRVVRDLAALPAALTRFLVPSSGTYNCRVIAGTSRMSVHGFAAAIDINASHADYWRWAKPVDGRIPWRNRVPLAIVEAFERHGFIWGGKWYHYDTMHFEYRPELIALAKQGWPRPQ